MDASRSGVAPLLAVEFIVASAKSSSCSFLNVSRLPELHSVLSRRPNPVHSVIVFFRERPRQILDLDQLAEQGSSPIAVVLLEQGHNSGRQLSGDLNDRPQGNDRILAEAKWGPSLYSFRTDDRSANPKPFASPLECSGQGFAQGRSTCDALLAFTCLNDRRFQRLLVHTAIELDPRRGCIGVRRGGDAGENGPFTGPRSTKTALESGKSRYVPACKAVNPDMYRPAKPFTPVRFW